MVSRFVFRGVQRPGGAIGAAATDETESFQGSAIGIQISSRGILVVVFQPNRSIDDVVIEVVPVFDLDEDVIFTEPAIDGIGFGESGEVVFGDQGVEFVLGIEPFDIIGTGDLEAETIIVVDDDVDVASLVSFRPHELAVDGFSAFFVKGVLFLDQGTLVVLDVLDGSVVIADHAITILGHRV